MILELDEQEVEEHERLTYEYWIRDLSMKSRASSPCYPCEALEQRPSLLVQDCGDGPAELCAVMIPLRAMTSLMDQQIEMASSY